VTGLELFVGLAIALGMVGILIPVLPGSLLILAAIGVWSFQIGTGTAYAVGTVCAALLLAAMVVKFAIPGKRMKASGVPNSTLLIGAVCAIVGFFVIPVLGVLVGFVLGVYLAEVRRLGSQQAWPSTKAALTAVGLSIAIEFASALLAACVWGVGVALT
jgi:uncharacterized protein YqgC (DUF456 family)